MLPHLTPIRWEACFWKGIVKSSPGEKSASFREGSEHMIYRGPWSEEESDLEGHKAKEEDEMAQCTS